jgi:hypothetical protein
VLSKVPCGFRQIDGLVQKNAQTWTVGTSTGNLPARNNGDGTLDVLDAYDTAHFQFLPDGRAHGIYDVKAIIRQRYIHFDNPREALKALRPTEFFDLYSPFANSWVMMDNSIRRRPRLVAQRAIGRAARVFSADQWSALRAQYERKDSNKV